MNKKDSQKVHFMAQASMIAAIYTALTLALSPVSYGPVQFRISEALCILPYFTPAAVPGLFLGCLISNGIGAAMGTTVALDMIFGSLATLIGALGSRAVRKKRWLVCIPPILSNTIIVPWVLRYAYGVVLPIPFLMLTVGIGEVVSCGILGNFLISVLGRYRNRIFSRV